MAMCEFSMAQLMVICCEMVHCNQSKMIWHELEIWIYWVALNYEQVWWLCFGLRELEMVIDALQPVSLGWHYVIGYEQGKQIYCVVENAW